MVIQTNARRHLLKECNWYSALGPPSLVLSTQTSSSSTGSKAEQLMPEILVTDSLEMPGAKSGELLPANHGIITNLPPKIISILQMGQRYRGKEND